MTQTILYIEDNMDNAEIVETMLAQSGYEVYIASDHQEGMTLVAQHTPDLIICDYHLPEVSGADIVKSLRQLPDTSSTPVLILTADIFTEAKSLSAGANMYLTKPIRRNQLLDAVSKLL